MINELLIRAQPVRSKEDFLFHLIFQTHWNSLHVMAVKELSTYDMFISAMLHTG